MINRLLAEVNVGTATNLGNGSNIASKYSSPGPLISIILKNSLIIAGIIFLGLLIFGGVGFIMNAGSGDSKKADQSRQAITSAIIGFAVILCSYIIIQIIQKITGLEILNSTLK